MTSTPEGPENIHIEPGVPSNYYRLMKDFASSNQVSAFLLSNAGRRIDLLISDIAPNPTGDANTDHVRIIHLCRALLQFGIEGEQPSPLLAEDGVFLCKVFDGPLRKEFANQLREKFATVTIVKPEASRGTSSETYLFASGLLRK